ncbi:MAG TPA: lipopolysaccharide assembly protein LapA domain-containing protein [Dokdonella sp.]|uniref:lipopolysaccharide assembly protein LapA domain-containing protein n=1 Tax=Dokdonella sp. TaxID=2291710 RepID=UPI002D7EFBCB|nr:lipopolysaccharide assembly protein LapA domain-containing protein [Dokdonella sp.]HET9034047.1 lipopolysaccharide assembly protein LapA domain-containing protein [Dokdonella sp.]
MRLGVVVLVLLAVVFGATFGALNSERMLFDLYFTEVSLPKGAALLSVLLIGWIMGGLLVWLVRVRRLRRELRTTKRALQALRNETAPTAIQDESSGRT